VATSPGLLGRWSAKRVSGSVRGISANVPLTALAYLNIYVVVRTVSKLLASTFPSRVRPIGRGMSVLGPNILYPKLTRLEDPSKGISQK